MGSFPRHRRIDSEMDFTISSDRRIREKQPSSSPPPYSPRRFSSPNRWPAIWEFTSFSNLYSKILTFPIPSCFMPLKKDSPTYSSNNDAIAALDGLRGVAVLVVLNDHLTYNFDTTFSFGYGVNNLHTLIQLPFIRVLWCSSAMIAILFVASGYTLSHRPLQQSHAGDFKAAHRTLTSYVFRRGMSLYLPAFISLYICAFLTQLGVFDKSRENMNTAFNFWHLQEQSPARTGRFAGQIYDVTLKCVSMLNIWGPPNGWLSAGDYDQHIWIVPVEFVCSMICLLFLVSVSQLRRLPRLCLMLLFTMFTFVTRQKYTMLFACGMLLADIDLYRKRPFGGFTFNRITGFRRAVTSPLSLSYFIIFMFGTYILSTPQLGANDTHGYRHLVQIFPDAFLDNAEWVRIFGAIPTVWAVANSSILFPIFTNKITAYLGKIWFSFYLIHGNVIKAILHRNMPWILNLTGDGTKEGQSTTQLTLAWSIGVLMVLPLTLWLADMFWRAVELPSIELAKFLEDVLSASNRVPVVSNHYQKEEEKFRAFDNEVKYGRLDSVGGL